MSFPEFRTERIVELLDELERRLAARGVALNIQIVGGAALLLHGLLDRSTEDIDARYASAPAVEEVAREMAVAYGLPVGWLNSKAAAFLPDDAVWIAGKEGSSSAIWLADLQTLAAMKLAAERQKDIEDLGRIANALGITDPADLVRIAYEKYGEDSVPLSASRENYEIVAEEAIAAASALKRH
ncbi:DUF6036 family nucleotidyltransferase [Paeniglutamicibacter sp. NPDC091659]|uniref:DUF6036 family nucleotidyltransferase n=1 Tax=Paeniglutamicibacter sp. NPDC091659 TaxID=3364389 RepID=UPI0038167D10